MTSPDPSPPGTKDLSEVFRNKSRSLAFARDDTLFVIPKERFLSVIPKERSDEGSRVEVFPESKPDPSLSLGMTIQARIPQP